ncbi:TRAP transporter small permease subunit [Nitratireductor sp. XY-223]|uniref:TRAP transporter small permease n=1 Tax=Nitratireductor sp. XY-223 TaxID=2561926 RepID=UPI00145AC03B|nr:TRAP transporter small permease subunit [Nitratireductor sp. XY-223]
MAAIIAIIRPLAWINTMLLRIGRNIAWVAMGLMVLIIVLQVVFRYVLNDALSWSEEAARFLMLWMTALIAPSAYRWGGFVSIDLVHDMLPKRVGSILALILLLISLMVLVVAIQLGYNHVNSGWLFASQTLKLDLSSMGWGIVRVKQAWMYMSVFVGVILLTIVNIELCLKTLAGIIDPTREVPADQDHLVITAE